MKAFFTGLMVALFLFAPAGSEQVEEEKPVRELAASLRKKGSLKGEAAFCAYTNSRPGNYCAGQAALEDSVVLHGDGSLVYRRFRSFAESHLHNPGEFTGKVDRKVWRDLLGDLSGLRWLNTPNMPMPSHSDTHRQLVLAAGKSKASYTIAGQIPFGQDSIMKAFRHLESLGDSASDTLWSIGLDASKARFKDGILEIEAVWRLAGRVPVEISLPSKGSFRDCGSLTLDWFKDLPETPGMTPLPVEVFHSEMLSAGPSAGTWKLVKPGKTESLTFKFRVPKGHAYKGNLIHLGAQVRISDKSAPVMVTVFSPQFAF